MDRKKNAAGSLLTVLLLATAPHTPGQTAPAASAAEPNNEESTIVLSPFTVEADEDEGYAAKSTLAGTRVRTELKDVASAISVVTKEFLLDTGARNSEDLLVYTPSTEVAGIRGNFTGVAGSGIYQENTISTATRVRGLDSADNTRDYFLTDIPWDGFNVGRVDLQRGPNSILFGIGSPAGIINTSTNDAAFKTAYHFENRVDEYSSVRNALDLNQNLIPRVLSVRVAFVEDDNKYEQKPAFRNSTRYYGAVRFDPKIFGDDNHTSIRVKYEDGKINSNNPRQLPPVDNLSLWFKKGADAYGNPGYNKVTINQFSLTNPNPSGVPLPGGKGGTLTTGLELANQGRSFWPDVINYYEATPTNLNSVATPAIPSGTPIKTIVAQPNTGKGLRDANGNTLGGVNAAFLPLAIPQMSSYAFGVGDVGAFPGKPIPGGVYYANVVLQDPSIFDFYSKLLDGGNKHEWQNWSAVNGVIEQSFLGDRFAFQFAYDRQTYDSGAAQFMSQENYAINVDINETYADGTPNPNVGRPYAANGASSPGLNYSTSTIRNTVRFTPTAELRASDFFGDSKLAKILGKHNFTGLYERNTVIRESVNWAQYATTPEYILDNSRTVSGETVVTSQLNSNRSFEWLAYLGPSLKNASSPAGANLQNIPFTIEPPKTQTAINFNSTWNKPTSPGTAGYVDPTAPYTYTNYVTGAQVTGTQVDNPANYVGWTSQPITWLSAKNPEDFKDLVQSGQRTRFRDISRGVTWQGYFLGGDLVPAFGWRKDVITNYQSSTVADQVTGYSSLDYPDNLNSRSDIRGESKSWGGVYHIPKKLTSWIPWGTTVSVFYDRSRNFKADASRLSLAGEQIPNAAGDTKEYGVTITTMNDKLTLKLNKFKTKVANATLSETAGNSIGGLGSNGYFLADGVIWGYGWATSLQDGLLGRTPGTNYWDYAAADGFQRTTPAENAAADNYNLNGGTAPNGKTFVGAKKVIDAWLKLPVPPSFFASYNLSPALDPSLGSKTGNLRDSYPTGVKNENGPNTGGGSSFGNHVTTVDNLSSGTEVELLWQPLKTWNISVNYSKVDATHENVDPVSQQFIGDMTAFMNGPGGQVREWFNGGDTVGQQWNSSIVAPFTVLLNQLGHAAPEVSPWRFNAVSTYTFDRGLLKGVFVGGAYRLEAGRIIGYAFDPTFKNVNSTDPRYSNVPGLTLGGLNVDKPFYGEDEDHLDAWIGYSRKVTKKVNWRVQVNIRSLGESNKLVAARVNPDGSVALARIVQGMGWQLTNSFDF